MGNAKILVVEDEGISALDIKNTLVSLGYDVSAVVSSGEQALQKAAETEPDLVLMDIRLKGKMDGVETAEHIHARFHLPVVYLTAHADQTTLERAKATEPSGYLLKPFSQKELHTTIEMALYRHEMEKRLKESEERYRQLFEQNLTGVYRATLDGRFLDCNRAFARIFGYDTPEEVLAAQVSDFYPDPADQEAFLTQLREKSSLTNLETRLRRRDGGLVWCLESVILIEGEEDAPPVIQGTLVDITERKWAERALQRSRQLLEMTFVGLRDAVFIIGRDARIADCNPAASKIFGYSRREMLGQKTTFLHADESGLEEFQEQLYRAVEANGFLFLPEFKMRRKDGAIFPAEYNLVPLEVEQGKRTSWVSVVRDITERVQAQAVLQQHARELELLNRAGQTFNATLELNQVLATVLKEVCSLLGVIGASIWLIDRETDELVCRQVADPQSEVVRSWRLAQGEGIAGWVARNGQSLIVPDTRADDRYVREVEQQAGMVLRSILSVPLRVKRKVIGVLQVVDSEVDRFTSKDLALLEPLAASAATAIENARLFKQVRAGRERLQALSRRLVEVQESERRYVACELHDEIGQILTGLLLTLDMSKRLPVDQLKASLEEAQEMINQLLTRVRELSLDLRPTMLDDFGLLPTLLWYVERYTAKTGIQVNFRHSGLEGRFSPAVETASYRIVQEALTNVARHAGVSEVTVRLWANQEVLGMQIEDQGTGFDLEAALATSNSNGLSGMRERAALLEGHLAIESAPGAGTRLTAEIPLTDPVELRK